MLFAVHGVCGAVLLIGAGNIVVQRLARALLALVIIHAVISIILTIPSLKAWFYAKALYFKENKNFWIRRISGIAILILVCLHIVTFGHANDENFTLFHMLMQLLFVVSILAHLIGNVEPIFVSFGCRIKKKTKDSHIFIIIGIECIFGIGNNNLLREVEF
jgi:hypothetical protein